MCKCLCSSVGVKWLSAQFAPHKRQKSSFYRHLIGSRSVSQTLMIAFTTGFYNLGFGTVGFLSTLVAWLNHWLHQTKRFIQKYPNKY